MEHGGLPRRKSLPISSSLWGEEGGSAQHQKPGEDASYAQTAATIAPTKHNHIAGSSPIRSFFFLSFFSSSSCETSSVVRVRQHQPQFSSPLVPHRNVFCLKAQARGFLGVRACVRAFVCVCVRDSWSVRFFSLFRGELFFFSFFFFLFLQPFFLYQHLTTAGISKSAVRLMETCACISLLASDLC